MNTNINGRMYSKIEKEENFFLKIYYLINSKHI